MLRFLGKWEGGGGERERERKKKFCKERGKNLLPLPLWVQGRRKIHRAVKNNTIVCFFFM
jgi:hypothetical protein